jgi:putative ABC transport system permease protein
LLGLVLTNLTRRRGRTALTALGVGLGVAIIVALLSLTQGLRNTAAGFIHLGGSDLGVFQSGTSDPTTSVLPESMVARIRASPQVSRATPVALVVESVPRDPAAVVFGVQQGGFFLSNLVVVAGRQLAPGEVMVGERLASMLHLRPGETLAVKGRRFPIAGVYRSGINYEDSGAVLTLPDAQALAGRGGETTLVAVQLAPGRHAQAAGRALERQFPGTEVISDSEQASRAGANGALIDNAVTAIIVVALIIGGIGVTNTMFMAVVERQGELALLSTVGWSSLRVGLLVVGEGVAVSLVGAALGLLLGVLGSQALVNGLGVAAYVSPSVTAWGLAQGLIIGIAIGVLGGIYPAWRVTRMPPLRGLARA